MLHLVYLYYNDLEASNLNVVLKMKIYFKMKRM